MLNPTTLEEYAIFKIKELEEENKRLANEVECWKNNFCRENKELNDIKIALHKVGTHKYSPIYESYVVDFSTAVEKYDLEAYSILSKAVGPVEGEENDEASENEKREA